ncbi:MAG: dienelactone hydrolase family protein [Candidatus Wallbacteria bacterium]|nr:dienelactone hydrolase family protein [Candidatus Wallbacteria bacterium]
MKFFKLSLIIMCLNTFTTGVIMAEPSEFQVGFFESASCSLPFRIYTPGGDAPAEGPGLLLFLHGMGERGSENEKQLWNGVSDILAFVKKQDEKIIILVPQCPENGLWVDGDYKASEYRQADRPSKPMKAVIELLNDIISKHGVNRKRIYATGLSMGGFGTWDLIMRKPEMFAAAVPVCGGGDPLKAEKTINLPVWIFHGGSDPVVRPELSRIMKETLEKKGIPVRYTEYPGVGHNSWSMTYSSDEVLLWLFRQTQG